MFRKIFLIVSLGSFLSIIYGILFTYLYMEENSCRMTYMFEYPQFVKIHFDENQKFSSYGLYSYSEGFLTQKARSMEFSGAPVIFIPGNGGSYKQARSLASVAIRKGLDNHWTQHLDYFSVDFNEEYSALFGGHLEKQKSFLKACIKTVLELYKIVPNSPKQVVLIGHSMGGKIAESIMADKEYYKYINTIISIASPVDRPVINLDGYFDAFYRKIDNILLQDRTIYGNNSMNYCTKGNLIISTNRTARKKLDDVLFITIGGGSRDILVHNGLTHSKYSDVHALATSIPNVWLTTDHLCSVWCLQLILVINRFLYSIIANSGNNKNFKSAQYFIEDKFTRSSKAHNFFVKSYPNYRNKEVSPVPNPNSIGDWVENSRKVYSRRFDYGINYTLVEMIRFVDSPQYQMLYAEVLNVDNDDWIFVCAALEVRNNMRYCSKAQPLFHLVNKLPSLKHKRRFIWLDLHKIKQMNNLWTHVLLRLPPTKQVINLNIDIHAAGERTASINMPKWYSFNEKTVTEDTIIGSSFFQLKLFGLHESHQNLALKIKPRSCATSEYHVVAQVCIPWARGYDRYQYFTHEKNDWLNVYTPISRPTSYNATNNPILINLHLDPTCRYTISYQNSFGGTMSRIDLQYLHWIPAHLTAILLLSLKYQISLTPKELPFKCGKLHSALLNSSSFFIITATRIFAKFVFTVELLPKPDSISQSTLISVIIHGSSLILLTFITAGIWLAITFYGNVAHKIVERLVQLQVPSISSIFMVMVEKFPITAGVALVSIASASCGGLSMLCGCCIYFLLITKQYESYLEEFIYDTAKVAAKKLVNEVTKNFLENKETNEESKKNTGTSENCELVEEALADGKDSIIPGENGDTSSENKDKVIRTGIKKDLNEVDVPKLNPPSESNDEDDELDRLLKESIEKQKQLHEEKNKKEFWERKEYNSIDESMSSINFHMTMWLLFAVISLVNLPSTIFWAKNFKYASSLSPDPSYIPSVIVILSASILWQMSTPRNIYAYQFLSCILYVSATVCVLFCQDSVHRLNVVISAVFIFVALHQLCAPRKQEKEGKADLEVQVESILQNKIDNLLNEPKIISPED